MNLERYTDKELAECLKNENCKDEAFREIYRRYSSMIIAYCRCLIYRRDIAEDIFQETFIKFYQSIDTKFEYSNIPGYLTTIAKNLFFNYQRLKKNTVEIDENKITQDINLQYDNKELLELIITSLDLIDDDYREIFILREFEGRSYSYISEKLKISVGNAKVRLLRAKQKIISVLSPYLKDLSKNG